MGHRPCGEWVYAQLPTLRKLYVQLPAVATSSHTIRSASVICIWAYLIAVLSWRVMS